MKYIYSIGLFCLISCFWVTNSNAQAPNCFDAYLSPFCSGIAQYPANSDGTGSGSGPQAPAGPNYDCLGTQGNPSYFSLTIQQTGNISFTLDNTANVDIDFILWGPFSNLTTASNACDSMGQGNQWGDVADCSYSVASQELVEIANAQNGEIYVLMVTNYANTPTNIFSTNNTGTGGIACPCDIPYTVDTMPAVAGNQGYLVDTFNNVNRFLVCPGNTLGIQVGARGSLNDTISLYGPFTNVNTVFPINSIFAVNPNPPSKDSLTIFNLVTTTNDDIGVRGYNIGLRNDLNTGGFSDSSCFDLLDIQVIVPGVSLSDRDVCSGEVFKIIADSIPTTTLGSSNYSWRQIHGSTVSFSSTTSRTPTVTIPTTNSTSSNDSIIIVVDYDYGTLCPMSDTMILRFPDMSITTTALPDSVCAGQTSDLLVVLSDTLYPPVCNDYNVNTIPFAPIPGTGTSLTLGDDALSASLPIGFNFNFFCNNYTNFFISSNGFITFNPSSGNGCCTGLTIPSTGFSNPDDLIAMCWTDCNPTTGGTIEYFTVGTAPNRQLIVNFINISPFSTNIGNQTVQAILFESTNIIEIHVTNATRSGTSNLTIGIENVDGTLGHAAPGANANNTTITNTAFRFEPKNFGPFYTWSPAGSLNASDIADPIATITASTTYSVTVKDGVCSYIDTTHVHAIPSLNMPTVMCDSSTINSISFSWTNLNLPATGFYEYSLNGGPWVNVGTALFTTATGLLNSTTYTIRVRANDGTGGVCHLSPIGTTNCGTLNPDCIVNPPINIALTSTDLSCNNDSSGCINAVVTGGSGNPMNLTWSNGIIDIDSICNLTPGTYTLVVIDTFSTTSGTPTLISCIDSQTVTITEPPVLAITIDSFSNPSCNGVLDGTINTTTIGGTANYNYNWSGISNNTPDLSSLNGGVYTVTVIDANRCTDTAQITLVDPSPIVITVDSTINNSCAGTPDGAVYITASGGTGTLTYSWNPTTMTEDFIGASNGTYIVTVTDSTGCTNTAQATVNPTVSLTVSNTVTNPLCNGDNGTATLTVTSGSGNYQFDWGAASTTTTNTASIVAGNFVVTITDTNNGCTTTNTVNVVEPAVLTVTLVDTTNIGCLDAPNSGAIDIQVVGGTTPYSFVWDSGPTPNNEDLTGLAGGTYSVVVTDINNCTISGGPYTVEEVAGISVSITTITGDLSCDLQPIGSLQATGTGGSNITYVWSNANGTTNSTITNLGAGSYTVTATNNDGCTDIASGTINAPVIPTVDAFVSVTGMTSVSVPLNSSVIISAGTSSFNYNWTNTADPVTGNANIANPTAATTTTSPDPEGEYTYIVTASATTNDTTCIATDTVRITVEIPFKGIPTAFTPDGDGINDTFRPVMLANDEVKVFRIYNRWGQEIFNGDQDHLNGWDGTYQGVPQPTEVYLYLIEYQKESDPEPITTKGEFTLIR